jgi:hypothetical protein
LGALGAGLEHPRWACCGWALMHMLALLPTTGTDQHLRLQRGSPLTLLPPADVAPHEAGGSEEKKRRKPELEAAILGAISKLAKSESCTTPGALHTYHLLPRCSPIATPLITRTRTLLLHHLHALPLAILTSASPPLIDCERVAALLHLHLLHLHHLRPTHRPPFLEVVAAAAPPQPTSPPPPPGRPPSAARPPSPCRGRPSSSSWP